MIFYSEVHMTSDVYLTPREAAAYLRISIGTLAKRRVYNDAPKFYRIGRGVRYRKADLDEFMISSRVQSATRSAVPMDSQKCHVEAAIHKREPDYTAVEVSVLERGADGHFYPVPVGFVSEVQYIPEIMKALNWALMAARDLDDRVNRSSSSEGGDNE
jgi:excisionase family DNA binding protein